MLVLKGYGMTKNCAWLPSISLNSGTLYQIYHFPSLYLRYKDCSPLQKAIILHL